LPQIAEVLQHCGMEIYRRSLPLLLCLLAAPSWFALVESGPADAARAMGRVERSSTRRGEGDAAAFLAFLADDASFFDRPVNGKESGEKRAETGLDLIWGADICRMRAVPTRIYHRAREMEGEKRRKNFSVTDSLFPSGRKQKDGSWKVALDCGIENPEPDANPSRCACLFPDDSTGQGRQPQALATRAPKNSSTRESQLAEAVLGVAAEEIPLPRRQFPSRGKTAAGVLLSAKAGTMFFEQLGGE